MTTPDLPDPAPAGPPSGAPVGPPSGAPAPLPPPSGAPAPLPAQTPEGAASTPLAAGHQRPPGNRVVSPLTDGEWHRMHPLTPLFKGGFVLLVVGGIVVTNIRDRVADFFVGIFAPGAGSISPGEDPVDYILGHNLILVALAAIAAIILLVVAWFYVSWRFHTFRITGDDVEVRSGILFRTHRRAPLDRVQGVNLTRPLVARLAGMAKLEVVGAGLDANVKLEYLSTANAEQVRADILRLASGRRLAERGGAPADGVAAAPGTRMAAAAGVVSEGITGLIVGAEDPAAEPDSVVAIPTGRLIVSAVLSPGTLWLLIALIAVTVGAITGTPWILVGMAPALIGFGAYWVSQITKSLRYSIAPTPDGVRITFGLFTTITETIPPGRIHAIEIGQSILWRPFGWWRVRINRITGRSASDNSTDHFTTVLPIGTRADVEQVLRLILPETDDTDLSLIYEHGILGPQDGDPYTNTPRRARLLRLLSWKRNGFALADRALLLRRGVVWRSVTVLPYARMQSLGLHQGPLRRALRAATARVHTVSGPVSGALGAIDRDAAQTLFADVSTRAISAAAADRSHRWAGEEDAGGAPDAASTAPAAAAPAPAAASAEPAAASTAPAAAAPAPAAASAALPDPDSGSAPGSGRSTPNPRRFQAVSATPFR